MENHGDVRQKQLERGGGRTIAEQDHKLLQMVDVLKVILF